MLFQDCGWIFAFKFERQSAPWTSQMPLGAGSSLAQPIRSRERPLLGGLLPTPPQWQSLTCSHEGSGFGSRRWTGLCVSLPCPWQHGLVWEGGQVCRKPYSEGVTMLQSPFHRKWQQEHKFEHQQHSLQGPAYHTLASGFEELKLIVYDNRVKSAMNLPAWGLPHSADYSQDWRLTKASPSPGTHRTYTFNPEKLSLLLGGVTWLVWAAI